MRPNPLLWTVPLDARLRRMRAEGASWSATALALAVSRAAAITRGRQIGVPCPPRGVRRQDDDPGREPLPAGHPRAWAVLTAGTWLAGSAYPRTEPRGAGA